MCGCNLSLIGIVCLGPAGDFDYSLRATEAERLQAMAPDSAPAATLEQTADDWPTYRRDNAARYSFHQGRPTVGGSVLAIHARSDAHLLGSGGG